MNATTRATIVEVARIVAAWAWPRTSHIVAVINSDMTTTVAKISPRRSIVVLVFDSRRSISVVASTSSDAGVHQLLGGTFYDPLISLEEHGRWEWP